MTQAQQPFSHPSAPGGGEKAPRPRDMQGSLVAYSPRIFTPAGAPGNTTGVAGADPRDRVTADLYILQSAGPVVFGGSPEYEADPKPHTHSVMGPARFTGVWVSSQNIVKALAPGGQVLTGQMVLGRIVRSEVGKRPFNLEAVDNDPAAMALAVDIWSRLQLGTLRYNEPTELRPSAPAGSVNYGPAADPAYAAWQAQQAAAAQAAAAQAAPPVDPAYLAWQAQQAAAAAASAPAPVALPMPTGWTPAIWAGLTDDQKRQVIAAG